MTWHTVARMTPRLPVLLLALAAALLLVPSASASEWSVVAAVRATAKPIERTSTHGVCTGRPTTSPS